MFEKDLRYLLNRLDGILKQAQLLEKQYAAEIAAVHPAFKQSARNLLHYMALRDTDLRAVQQRLARLGLSSLGRAEAHTVPNLVAVRLHLLRMLDCREMTALPGIASQFSKLSNLLGTHSRALLGKLPASQSGYIMVTMASDMATDVQKVKDLLQAGMNSARINCAHDEPETWLQLIKAIRRASEETGIACKVFMDLAGPKIRTGSLATKPKVVQVPPEIGPDGKVAAPARVWLVPEGAKAPGPADAVLPMPSDWLRGIEHGHKIRFTDTRGRKRTFRVEERNGKNVLVRINKNSHITSGTELSYLAGSDEKVVTAEVGALPPQEIPLLLHIGNILKLHGSNEPGQAAKPAADTNEVIPAHVSITLPEVLADVKTGHRVLLNDGKIEGEVIEANSGELVIRITYAKQKGSKLRSEKGINFPDSELHLRGLTEKDREDLVFVAQHADVVNMSFVNTTSDVQDLFHELEQLEAKDLGVLLKIETKRAFNNLPRLLLMLMQRYPAGIMIARGDMAVEVGWNRLAEVQEEMLWLCQAAHVPVVWATQVLETLAKKGRPSRSEITDAAMSQRAECVMLNKGPFILDAVRSLGDIMKRMRGHQFKKAAMLRKLMVADVRKKK